MNQTIQEMMSQSSDPQMSNMLSMFSEKDLGNPMFAMMLAMMQNQNNNEEQATKNVTYKRKFVKAKNFIQMLQEQIAFNEELLIYLGEVFGACPACWGLNESCPDCHGQGHPGRFEPQANTFLSLISPAIARLNLQIVPKEDLNLERAS